MFKQAKLSVKYITLKLTKIKLSTFFQMFKKMETYTNSFIEGVISYVFGAINGTAENCLASPDT